MASPRLAHGLLMACREWLSPLCARCPSAQGQADRCLPDMDISVAGAHTILAGPMPLPAATSRRRWCLQQPRMESARIREAAARAYSSRSCKTTLLAGARQLDMPGSWG